MNRQSHSNQPRVTLNVGGDNLVFYPDGHHSINREMRRSRKSLSNRALGGSYKL